MNNKLPDYYKILGVDRLADDKEIERAFRQKAMQCHPDRFSDPKEKIQKTKEFQTINEAYTLLSKYSERKKYDADLERQEAEEQDRWERERQEKEARERRERGNQAQNQGPFSGFDYNGFWFETIKYRYRYESASIGEIKRRNASTSPEDDARIKRVLKPFGEGGSFFDTTSPIGEASMTIRMTGKELNCEFLFTKNGAYHYYWKGTFQMRGFTGCAARSMEEDFKSATNNAYNAAMDWASEIVQNGHPAPAEPEDDEWDEDEPESYDEVALAANSYDYEGDIENEKKYPMVEAWEGVGVIGIGTVPLLFFSVVSFGGGLTMLGAILLLFAILWGGFGFFAGQICGTFDYFKKTKPKPTPAKPQPAKKSPAPTPDAPIEWGWALVGGLALVLICMLIGGKEGMLLFGVVVGMSSLLGLVVLITK